MRIGSPSDGTVTKLMKSSSNGAVSELMVADDQTISDLFCSFDHEVEYMVRTSVSWEMFVGLCLRACTCCY